MQQRWSPKILWPKLLGKSAPTERGKNLLSASTFRQISTGDPKAMLSGSLSFHLPRMRTRVHYRTDDEGVDPLPVGRGGVHGTSKCHGRCRFAYASACLGDILKHMTAMAR